MAPRLPGGHLHSIQLERGKHREDCMRNIFMEQGWKWPTSSSMVLDNHMTILDPNWAGKCTLTGCLVRKERGMLICHISIVGTLRTRAVSFSSLRMAHGFCMRVCVENLPTIRTFLCCCRRVFFLLVRCSVRS